MNNPFRYTLTNAGNKNDKTKFIVISKSELTGLQQYKILNEFISGKTYLPSGFDKMITIYDDFNTPSSV